MATSTILKEAIVIDVDGMTIEAVLLMHEATGCDFVCQDGRITQIKKAA